MEHERGQAPWVAMVAAFFREPLLSKKGAAWRLALTAAAVAALAAVLLAEFLPGPHQ
jgi:hypothetical protein